jgi:hypothetical protein
MIRRPTSAVHNGDLTMKNKMPQHRRMGLLALVRATQSINRRRIGPLRGLSPVSMNSKTEVKMSLTNLNEPFWAITKNKLKYF